jgi:ribonuclease P protein component
MLPKPYRLTTPQFRLNKNSYSRFSTPFFTLLMKPSNSETPRFTFVTPKSLDKRSTVRNRTKRIISALIFKYRVDMRGYRDVFVKLHKIVNDKNKQELNVHLLTTFEKAGLYSKT